MARNFAITLFLVLIASGSASPSSFLATDKERTNEMKMGLEESHDALKLMQDEVAREKVIAKEIRCPAPIFVAEGPYCVCKDPDNCPSTVETMTPEEAAALAAEAHTWNQSGAPGTR